MENDQAFVEFTRANYSGLFRTAVFLTGDRSAAEDLVQETLTRLYPVWWRVEAADAPLAYVRRTLTNQFLTGRRRSASTEVVTDVVSEHAAHDDTDDIVNRSLSAQLLAMLGQKQRAAVVLRYYNDLTDDQIAVAIGCRPATARSLIHRGLATMRKESARADGISTGVGQGGAR